MADVARLLETLHPLREPPAPDAIMPSLILLVVGCLCAVVTLAILFKLNAGRRALRVSATAELNAARQLGPSERLAAQAVLLRRLVRGLAGDAAARAQGPAWLDSLDRTFATRFFTTGEGAVFGDALYRRQSLPDLDALDHSLSGLIAKVRG